MLSQVVRDWQLGWLLRYQNGALIAAPSSNNRLMDQLLRQGGFNGLPNNDNRVAGVNPLAVDPNCHCFNPQTTLVLNPEAWRSRRRDSGAFTPFYSDYRWQRQPAESMSFARNFRFGHEGRYDFFIRAELQNIAAGSSFRPLRSAVLPRLPRFRPLQAASTRADPTSTPSWARAPIRARARSWRGYFLES